MNWQEVMKLLRDNFAHADSQILVYTLEENGVHAMSAEGDAEFYADDELERYSEEFFLDNRELATDFTKILNPANRPVMNNSQSFARKATIDSSITTSSKRNLRTTLKNSTSSSQTLPMKK